MCDKLYELLCLTHCFGPLKMEVFQWHSSDNPSLLELSRRMN
jgi:hypothetical protein